MLQLRGHAVPSLLQAAAGVKDATVDAAGGAAAKAGEWDGCWASMRCPPSQQLTAVPSCHDRLCCCCRTCPAGAAAGAVADAAAAAVEATGAEQAAQAVAAVAAPVASAAAAAAGAVPAGGWVGPLGSSVACARRYYLLNRARIGIVHEARPFPLPSPPAVNAGAAAVEVAGARAREAAQAATEAAGGQPTDWGGCMRRLSRRLVLATKLAMTPQKR